MMGRFSCFYGQSQCHKPKKPVRQQSFETMIKMLQLGSQNHSSTNSINPTTLNESPRDHARVPSRGCKSGELKCDNNTDSVHFEVGNLGRSLSVGCELHQKGRIFDDNNSDNCIDQDFSCDSRDCNETGALSVPNDAKSPGTTVPDQDQEALQSVSPHNSSDPVNHESVFSAGDPHFSEKEGQTPRTSSIISKSYSMPNFESSSPELSPRESLAPRNRSFEDLNVLGIKKEDVSVHNASTLEITGLNKDDNFYKSEKFEGENGVMDNYDSYNYASSSKDWIVPVPHEMGAMKHEQGESSSHHRYSFPHEDFKIKRIEDWVIDLQHCRPEEEINEIDDSRNEVKVETKINPGMEAAKRYISSLNATATTAQLANHGLVAIPFLSAFVSLKVLNLSGNSIVRITAGALPRGLHMLNLSKNKISTIEGLRELTRLRVLDLSYNKLCRIGHGLASCASLKELYLAGNKISEVEGLHRLLKLTVLDLRFNKIATSKSLGQLAANYNSLQAISLEGNPAQKNVGDEQLKKYLQGLLPHLAYYNRQHIKTSTLKDPSDRSVRLGISAHQFDRGLRSDHKSSSRRGSSGSGANKRSTQSSTHGLKGLATDSTKQARGRHGLVPLSGTRIGHQHQNHQFDIGNNAQKIHKSRSEGTLAAL